jgi:hypothetical protein
LVQTAIVSSGKRKSTPQSDGKVKRRILLPGKEDPSTSGNSYSSVLGISAISAAPSLDLYSGLTPTIGPSPRPEPVEDDVNKKKKYEKEAWPGRKKMHSVI